jgi:hypothetical protein
VVSAPDPVEVNPFVQTGPTGTVFTENEPGVKVQGDAFDSFVPLAGVGELDTGFGLGFQYFTAGDVLEPESQLVLLRVSPIPGAAFIEPVPEPGTALLTLAALCAGVSWTRRGSREP